MFGSTFVPSGGKSSAGVYTPALTNILNVAASALGGTFFYLAVGNTVFVGGAVQVQPAAVAQFQLSLSLPVPAVFTDVYGLSGNATTPSSPVANGSLSSYVPTQRALLACNVPDLVNRTYRVVFIYKTK